MRNGDLQLPLHEKSSSKTIFHAFLVSQMLSPKPFVECGWLNTCAQLRNLGYTLCNTSSNSGAACLFCILVRSDILALTPPIPIRSKINQVIEDQLRYEILDIIFHGTLKGNDPRCRNWVKLPNYVFHPKSRDFIIESYLRRIISFQVLFKTIDPFWALFERNDFWLD